MFVLADKAHRSLRVVERAASLRRSRDRHEGTIADRVAELDVRIDAETGGVHHIPPHDTLDAVRTKYNVGLRRGPVLEMDGYTLACGTLREVRAAFVEVGARRVDMLHQGIHERGAMDTLRHLLVCAILLKMSTDNTAKASFGDLHRRAPRGRPSRSGT